MATQKQLAARALFARRAKSGAFHRVRRAGRRVRTRLSRRRSLGGEPVMARRRMRRSYGRFRGRLHRPSKQSLVSKISSGVALAIGFSPVIESAALNLPSGNMTQFKNEMIAAYTGFDSFGTFHASNLAKGYVPILGAIVFKKAFGYLLKVAKLKI